MVITYFNSAIEANTVFVYCTDPSAWQIQGICRVQIHSMPIMEYAFCLWDPLETWCYKYLGPYIPWIVTIQLGVVNG